MTERLHTGELERKVLEVLWANGAAMTPGSVHAVLAAERDLAYTTVMTILVRLWRKGELARARSGRAFEYRPLATKEEYLAVRMRDVLAAATDPAAALGHFVKQLDGRERRLLRRLLGGGS